MKVLVSVLVAVVLLTAGGATAVMADDGSTPTSNTANTTGLLARVAEILEIPREDLVNAFNQAQQEMRQEASIRFLDKAVEDGLITQQEADEIKGWWEQRPEGIDRLPTCRFLGKALHNRHMWSANRGWSEEAPYQAMERGLIGEGKANQLMERWQNRQETQNCLFSRDRIRQAVRGLQAAGPMGWQGMRSPKLAN